MKSEHDKKLEIAFYVMLTGWLLIHIALMCLLKFEWVTLIAGIELFVFGTLAFISILKQED